MVPWGEEAANLTRTRSCVVHYYPTMAPESEGHTDWVRLRSAEFTGALATVFKFGRGGRLVRLWFGGDALRIQCASCSLGVPAEGQWRGEATAPARDFKVVLRMREKFPEVIGIRRSGSQLSEGGGCRTGGRRRVA